MTKLLEQHGGSPPARGVGDADESDRRRTRGLAWQRLSLDVGHRAAPKAADQAKPGIGCGSSEGGLGASATGASARRIRRRAEPKRVGEDPLHQAGCMLYWAEGSKDTQLGAVRELRRRDGPVVRPISSHLLRPGPLMTCRFGSTSTRATGSAIEEIEEHWLTALELPRSCLASTTLNHFPTSSSGKKKNKLPYGVCTVRVESEHPDRPAHLRRDSGVRRVRRAAVAGRAST